MAEVAFPSLESGSSRAKHLLYAEHSLLYVQVANICEAGYGFCQIPTAPGLHELECCVWKPLGTQFEELASYFFGAAPQLTSDEVVYSSADRFRLRSATAGNIHLRLNIIAKDFARHGVQLKGSISG